MGRYAQITGAGMYLPPREVTNDELRAKFDAAFPEFVDKMEASSGIHSRFWAPDDWATSDVALPAAQNALKAAGKKPEDVDLIILGTDSPDYITPATSVVLQHKLGAKNAGTFDVGCACASFPTALAAASGIIATNEAINTVLVVGVYLMHRLADPNDPMIFFYGDGAGAFVLEARKGEQGKGFLASAFLADGAYHRHWGIYSGGTFEPATAESVHAGRTRVRLIERYPPEVNHEGWPKLVREVTRRAGVALADVDVVLFTQVRKPSIELVMENLGLPMSKTHTIMEKWGYTGSACIPMAFVDAVAHGVVQPQQLVVLVGSGVGYNQAAVAFRLEELWPNR
ncbi:MAG: 3-oxoacyl-ACP synthase III family protein [Thermoanaerobaculum sp.]